MTDNTAPNPAPASPDPASPSQNWEVVTFPGQVAIPEAQRVGNPATSPVISGPDTAAPAPDRLSTPVATAPATESLNHRTAELIQLIQDLNQCNDALLVRVSDLEESLERSQTALQAEVERHQGQGSMGNERPSQPQPVPQQIAQLLTEIDIANDGLRRATIHNETLQTELESSQQRVAQLERECTLLQQRFSEKSTALQQAEDSCRDLKARLHRQQGYTLQFKTALEKCLNMSGEGSAQEPLFAAASRAAEILHPVAMPKAPEIQPWSAQADPNPDASGGLANLLHSLKAPGLEPVTASPAAAPVTTTPLASPPPPLSRGEVPPLANPVEQIAPVATPTTETPPPVTVQPPVAPAASAPLPEPPVTPQPTPWPPSLVPQPEPEAPVVFTEPSPWGAPMIQPPTTPAPPVAAALETPEPLPVPDMPPVDRAVAVPAQPPIPRPEPTTPAYLSEDLNGVTPAPVVYPSRSQKKIPSLAAVQLPSFGRSTRRS